MNQKILFEIKKFSPIKKAGAAVFFTDRKKVSDFEKAIKILPKNSAIIIREYDLDKNSREIFARKIMSLARDRSLKILVGKDIALAKKIQADGVHFSDFDKLPLQFFKKKSFPQKFIFSFACHSEKSFLYAQKFSPDFTFIAPVFSTSSHVEAKSFGIRSLAKIAFKSSCSKKIYALGGANLDNIKSLRKLGIGGFGAIDLFRI